MNEEVVYRVIDGNTVDGLWNGSATWKFEYEGRDDTAFPVTFDNGKWVVIREDTNTNNPRNRYIVSEPSRNNTMHVEDPNVIQGIEGFR